MPGFRYLSHFSQKPEAVAPRIEQLVRSELGAPAPVLFQILPGTSTGATMSSLLSEWAIQFAIAWPRQFELQVMVIRQGLGSLTGRFAFVVPLSRPIPGPVRLEPLSGKFTGNPAVAARLNSNRDLLRNVHRLPVSTSRIGRIRLSIAHYLQIQPSRTGSLLVVHRLPTEILFRVNAGVRDLLALVPMLEYAL